MENTPRYNWNTADPLEDVAELPREEVLARLYGLVLEYHGFAADYSLQCPFSLSRAADGLGDVHRFAFGCCKGQPESSPL